MVQRNFLDLVEVSRPHLQVALVVDGTESMGTELEGIRRSLRQMVEDLSRYKEQVSFQLVIFRDEGSPSGAIVFPLEVPRHGFTSDIERLRAAIDQIQAESGAPYFPELIDLGINEALTKLDWSRDDATSRWLMVLSDAPPFDEGFAEQEAKASRQFATSQLIATANRLAVKINCILCTSRPEDGDIQKQALSKTQQFMSRLTTDTGGLMLDLSYQDIREALEKAAQIERVSYQKIGQITREAIDNERQLVEQQKTLLAEGQRSRIAILPHMPLDKLSFDPSLEPVQVSAEMRLRFRSIPGAEVKSALAVERHAAILQARGVRGAQLLQSLANALNVDYVVWGTVARVEGNLEIQSAIYDRVTGNPIVSDLVRTGPQLPVTEVTGRLAKDMQEKIVRGNLDVRLAAAFRQVVPGSAAEMRLISPVAQTAPARTDLLMGFELLEKSLAYPAGDSQAEPLLTQARSHLEKAREEDQQNPLAYLLLANCCFNQAQALTRQGRESEAAPHMQQFSQALSIANRFRREAKFDYLRLEIEADYALLISKDFPAAAKIYGELAKISPDTPLHTALRAHWMLAGIHSGDWGVAGTPAAQALVNEAEARGHLIQILAHWPESSEGEFIRHNLRWDDKAGENQFEYLPRVNESAAKAVVGT
ncbi:MAG: vWA domain-containing protein [Pirellulaceae bacterium]